MHSGMTWQQHLQQLYAHIAWQSQRIDKLEQSVNRLNEELAAVKEQKRFHIDKIEYNFDQLKVEKLEGTLTIGVSPGALDAIEDFTVNGAKAGIHPTPSAAAADSHLEAQVNGHIYQYLQQDAWKDMKVIEDKYDCTLEDNYRHLIIEDIRNQIEARVRHYTNQYRSVGFDRPLDAVTQTIIDKTKTDIRGAMDMYISKLHENRGNHNES